MSWTLDGVEQFRHEGVGVPHTELYVILNLAIGGNWPKAADATTKFPAHYERRGRGEFGRSEHRRLGRTAERPQRYRPWFAATQP